jgi:hypothetical protein
MGDENQGRRREVSPERPAYSEQKFIARYGAERYAEFSAAVEALRATCTAQEWDEYVNALVAGLKAAPDPQKHFVQATTGAPATAWRVERFRRTQSGWRDAKRSGPTHGWSTGSLAVASPCASIAGRSSASTRRRTFSRRLIGSAAARNPARSGRRRVLIDGNGYEV